MSLLHSLFWSLGLLASARAESPADRPVVWPTPQQVQYGELVRVPTWKWDAKPYSPRFRQAALEILESSSPKGFPIHLSLIPALHGPQSYRLSVTSSGSTLTAETETGLFYGLQSLRWLTISPQGRRWVRTAEITDWPAFEWRGFIQGLEAVPLLNHLARYKFNLLQYPAGRGTLTPELKEEYRNAVHACDRQFALFVSHEGYQGAFGEKKLEDTPASLKRLAAYFNQRFDWGARAFIMAFDDMELKTAGSGQTLGAFHVKACRTVFDALKSRDPACRFFFCPVPYGGTPETGFVFSKPEEALAYLAEVRRDLPPEIRVFWTGTGVFSKSITSGLSRSYETAVGRPPFIWDNDPIHWCNTLQPLGGRSTDLFQHASGYVANLVENEAFHRVEALPVLLTIAQYLWNPGAYDDTRTLDEALAFLAGDRVPLLQEAWQAAADHVAKRKRLTRKEAGRLGSRLPPLRDTPFQRAFPSLLFQLAEEPIHPGR